MDKFLKLTELIRQVILGYEPVKKKPRKKRKYKRRAKK
jgi:hypothetical protein|tara:strand:- start:1624 stop:1737 length:114 start_codon:yes stop_codon:yes gene_type:complete